MMKVEKVHIIFLKAVQIVAMPPFVPPCTTVKYDNRQSFKRSF